MFDVVLYDSLTGIYFLREDVADWQEAIDRCNRWVSQDEGLVAYVISAWGRICLRFSS